MRLSNFKTFRALAAMAVCVSLILSTGCAGPIDLMIAGAASLQHTDSTAEQIDPEKSAQTQSARDATLKANVIYWRGLSCNELDKSQLDRKKVSREVVGSMQPTGHARLDSHYVRVLDSWNAFEIENARLFDQVYQEKKCAPDGVAR